MAHLRAWLSGLVLASCALSYDVAAQQAGVTRMGLDSLSAAFDARVRVRETESSHWHVGHLGRVNDRTLMLHDGHDQTISTPTIIAVQRSLGRRRLDGGFIGGPIGLVIGGVAGWAIGNDQRSANEPNGNQRSVGIIIGAATGTAIGALIGAALAPERWKDIRVR